jgi:hypothetical protein
LGAVGGAEAGKGELKLPSRQRKGEDEVRARTASPTRELGVSTMRNGIAQNLFLVWGSNAVFERSLFPSKPEKMVIMRMGSDGGSALDALRQVLMG